MSSGPKPILNTSVLGRLLEELSWEGSSIRRYRHGGRGYENVLTAEVLLALDFLPRQAFLGAVLRAAHGSETTLARIADEIEAAELTLLPEELKLRPSGASYQEQVVVQPDGMITSPHCVVMIEAKRIRKSKFQTEQLAREYIALMRDAAGRTPTAASHARIGSSGVRRRARAHQHRRGRLTAPGISARKDRRQRP